MKYLAILLRIIKFPVILLFGLKVFMDVLNLGKWGVMVDAYNIDLAKVYVLLGAWIVGYAMLLIMMKLLTVGIVKASGNVKYGLFHI